MPLLPDLKAKISYGEASFLKEAMEGLWAQILVQRPQLFLYLPVLLGLGIGFYFSMPAAPPLILGGLFCAIWSCLLFLLYPYRRQNLVLSACWLGGITLAVITLGFFTASLRTQNAYTPMLTKENSPVEVQGIIGDIEDLGEGEGSRIILEHAVIEGLGYKETPRKIRITVRKDEGLEIGQEIRTLAGLNPPSGPLIPDGFDFRRYAYFQGIGALGFSYYKPEIIKESSSIGFYTLVDGLRHNIGERIEKALPYPPAGIATALVVGKRTAISDEDYEAIRDSGLAHMLAISGLHVGLFSATFFFFARLIMAAIPGFALRHPIKKYAAVIGIVAAIFYMLIAGSTIPAQRAMMMSVIVFTAVILDRSALSLRLVAFAAFMVLLLTPESLLSVSFQMSFAAVAALVIFFDALRDLWSRFYQNASWLRLLALYFLGVCLTTIIASVATAPFALFHFQKLAAYSLLSNFIAVPLLAFVIMPFTVLALLMMPLGFEALPLVVVSKGITGMLEIAHWTAGLEGAVFRVTQWPESALSLLVISGLMVLIVKGALKAFAILPLGAAVIAIAQYSPPDIIVSENHKITAYSPAKKHLNVSNLRGEKFVRENWERLYALPEGGAKLWPKEGFGTDGIICGEYGCRLHHGAYKIAFSDNQLGLQEDCDWADIIIAGFPVQKKECSAQTIIDKFDTWAHGSHGIWLEEGKNIPAIRWTKDKAETWPWVK